MTAVTSFNHFLARFEALFALTEAERSDLASVPVKRVELRADQEIVREGDRPSRSVLVIEGLVSTSKVVDNGKRQTTAFYLPGDMPDLLSVHLAVMDSDVRTVTPTVVGFIEHSDIYRVCDRHPRIAASLWRTTLVDASIFREWVVNVGQRSGLSRIAHLFCEIVVRMEAIGLGERRSCTFNVTQNDLCEATGLSTVHVNRMLQELRARGLITFLKGLLTIHDWDALVSVGDFHADYLHLAPPRCLAGQR